MSFWGVKFTLFPIHRCQGPEMPIREPSFPVPALAELETINSESGGENPPWLSEEAKSKDSACGEKQRVLTAVSGLGGAAEDQGLMGQPLLLSPASFSGGSKQTQKLAYGAPPRRNEEALLRSSRCLTNSRSLSWLF